jgi:nucleotide-binding universal stress UspA family protein
VIQRILVPLDGSALAEEALPHALALTDVFRSQVILLRVVEADSEKSAMVDAVRWRTLRSESAAYLDGIKQRLRESNVDFKTVVADGRPADEILRAVSEHSANLIVLTSHGHRGVDAFEFGPTLHQVISAASVSILLVRPTNESAVVAQPARYRKILVPLDGSRRAEWALGLAASIASSHHAKLLMLHVVQVPEMPRAFPLNPEEERITRELIEVNRHAAEAYLSLQESQLCSCQNCERHLQVSTRVPQAIQEFAGKEDADLLVLSAHGYSGDQQWLYGGVAGSLIAHCKIPLLIFQDAACLEIKDAGAGGRNSAIRGVRQPDE